MKVMFVTARLPWPPLKGDQVRSFHQLKELSKRHDITLISFCLPDELETPCPELEEICNKVIRIPFRPYTRFLIGTWLALRMRWPGQVGLYHSQRLVKCIRQHLKHGEFDLLHIQLSRMASHASVDCGVPIVVDLIDALCLNMDRRADQERFWLAPLLRIEAKLMAVWERRVAATFSRSVVVSEVDRLAIGSSAKTRVIPNGVDLERFAYSREGRGRFSIVFSGNMSYFPNVDAACWFVHEVLPLVLKEIPQVEFVIAGTNPHARVRRLAEESPAVNVTGFVPSMEAELRKMAIAVAPMRSGTGIQNKVIEAMASGLPVVATSFALGGLRVEPDQEIVVADEATAMARVIVDLLKDPERMDRMAARARDYVEAWHSWEGSVAQLEEVWREAMDRHGAAK